MTTLICDFQSIVGKKIDGYATLTAGKTRPAYDAPSVVVHDPETKEVDNGRVTFYDVNPGDAVITVDWDDQTQSATLRFVVPESETPVYLADCLSGDYLTPSEIDKLHWGIKQELSNARGMIESATGTGLNELNAVIEQYFTDAAEILRKAVEAATRSEDALGTIDSKVGAVEGTVTTVDELQGITADALARIQALQEQLGSTDADLASIVRELDTITPTIHDAATKSALAVQEAQSATSELLNLQETTSSENARLTGEIEAANQEISQALTDLAGLNTRIGTEVNSILEEVSRVMVTASQGVEDARVANENLRTAQMQLATIQDEQYEIHNQQQTILSEFDARMAEIDAVQTDLDTATSDLSALTQSHSQLTQDMTNKVSALQTLTQAHSGELVTVKQRADKGVTDAAAAAQALTAYKGVNDPKVSKAQTDATKGINDAAVAKRAADQAAADAESKSAAAKTAAEEYAREQAEAAQAQAEENAAAEALRVAQLEAAAAKTAAASDAKAKADEAERLAKLYAEAQAKAAKESAEATAAKDAATKAENARIAAEANAKVLSDKAQQAAAAAQSSIDNLEIGGRNYFLNSGGVGAPVRIHSNHGGVYPITQGEDEHGAWIQGEYADGSGWFISSYTNPLFESGYGTYYSEAFKDVTAPYTQSVEVMCMEPVSVAVGGGERVELTPGVWTRISRTQTGSNQNRPYGITASGIGDIPTTTRLYHRRWKLEAGTRATDWTPAPEDVDAGVAKAQAEAETARAEAESKSEQARIAAENAAREMAEQAQADAEEEAARVALEHAQREAQAAKEAAASDAKAKADEAERLAKVYAEAQATAAKEAAEATAAQDAATKANKAKEDAEKKAAELANAAQSAAVGALNTYKSQNDPKVTKAQQDANKGISDAEAAKKRADQGVADAAALREATRIIDTRNVENPPSYYWAKYPMTPVKEFTRENTLGISSSTSYIYLETTVPWTDSSGGSIVQRATRGNGGGKTVTYTRSSIGSRDAAYWSPWVNEFAGLVDRIDSLNDKAGELTADLSKAATQEQYNELNTSLWNIQNDVNEINKTLWEGQHTWNEVAADAIAAQATLLAKQDLWNAAQKEVNDKQGRWNSAAQEILDSTGKFQKLQNDFNAKVLEWKALQDDFNAQQREINNLDTEINEAQNEAIRNLQNAIAIASPGVDILPTNPKTGRPYWADALTPREDPELGVTVYGGINGAVSQRAKRGIQQYDGMDLTYQLALMVRHTAGTSSGLSLRIRKLDGTEITPRHYHGLAWDESKSLGPTTVGTIFISPGSSSAVTKVGDFSYFIVTFNLDPYTNQGDFEWTPTFTTNGTSNHFEAYMKITAYPTHTINSINALSKARDAQNILNRNQEKWNEAASRAIEANTTALAAKKVLDDNQNRWIQGADLAIANLQTTSAKFKQWTKAASDAIEAGELADEAQDKAITALREIIGDEGDNGQAGSLTHRISLLETAIPEELAGLQGEISKNTELAWHKHQWIRDGGLNLPNSKYFSITGDTREIKIKAVGTWIGSFTLIANTANGDVLQDWRNVTSSARDWTITKPSSLLGNWERATLDYSITPGEAVNLSKRSTSKTTLTAGGYRTLWSHTVPVSTKINASLNVGWHAATFDYRYGIRIRAGSGTILAEDGPRTGVGPRTPFGDGYRNMNRRVSGQTVSAGTTIYFEAYVSSGGVDQRTVRDFTANINYIK